MRPRSGKSGKVQSRACSRSRRADGSAEYVDMGCCALTYTCDGGSAPGSTGSEPGMAPSRLSRHSMIAMMCGTMDVAVGWPAGLIFPHFDFMVNVDVPMRCGRQLNRLLAGLVEVAIHLLRPQEADASSALSSNASEGWAQLADVRNIKVVGNIVACPSRR
ncbi:MAG: hypothetical protein FE78DRAFT_299894 [Acidomyces sp. 'richmondensis']|nr:MAG: hypothetical protein FE78DRAFT_299894 [Acidomyces sp. 'richmondensis']